jgi:GH24 family phage-related lysozyme (muramidase)
MYDTILAKEIAEEEGFSLISYLDTEKNWTIGIGHLLGKSDQHANIMWPAVRVVTTFMEDLNNAIYDVEKQVYNFNQLSPTRQRVLINMMFNLGANRFATFKQMKLAIDAFDYYRAYQEMLDSKWAKKDVPERAARLSYQWMYAT